MRLYYNFQSRAVITHWMLDECGTLCLLFNEVLQSFGWRAVDSAPCRFDRRSTAPPASAAKPVFERVLPQARASMAVSIKILTAGRRVRLVSIVNLFPA